MTDYAAILEAVLAAEVEEAARQGDEVDSVPRPGADAGAIARAEQARERTFAPSYRAFLEVCDGWEHFAWGVSLFGTSELVGEDYDDALETLEYDEELTEELEAALIIGRNENDATLILLCDDGAVVEHLYGEEERWPDLGAYLRSRIDTLAEMRGYALQAIGRTEREWDPAFRAADDAALVAELRARLAEPRADLEAPNPAAFVDADADPAVTPAELVLCDEQGDVSASVDLGLVLYLGAAPTRDETLACVRAFRARFPCRGRSGGSWPAP